MMSSAKNLKACLLSKLTRYQVFYFAHDLCTPINCVSSVIVSRSFVPAHMKNTHSHASGRVCPCLLGHEHELLNGGRTIAILTSQRAQARLATFH